MEISIDDLCGLQKMLNQTVNGFARSVAVLAEMEMMKATNEMRRSRNESDAYGEDAFAVLIKTQLEIVADIQQ